MKKQGLYYDTTNPIIFLIFKKHFLEKCNSTLFEP